MRDPIVLLLMILCLIICAVHVTITIRLLENALEDRRRYRRKVSSWEISRYWLNLLMAVILAAAAVVTVFHLHNKAPALKPESINTNK